ncbi:hypothetical protein [Lacticaseibacillus suibinensis]|uniref:hypothetical protein n=1 Tax=Lacticaseibacillus suibinensis TaxID=2486011 RepID=UPI001943216C|nr:hypothetical protein [Lacticaseibacillus suibinensis]
MYQHDAAVATAPRVPFTKSVAANAATEDNGIEPSAEVLPEPSGGGDVLVFITDNGWKKPTRDPGESQRHRARHARICLRSVALSFASTIKVIWLINQVKINMPYVIYLREKR